MTPVPTASAGRFRRSQSQYENDLPVPFRRVALAMGLVLMAAIVGLVGMTASAAGCPDGSAAPECSQAAAGSGDADSRESLAGDPEAIEAGRRIYAMHCYACHGTHGEGGIGMKLRDSHQEHGEGYEGILNTVTNGVPGKPMNPWKDKLTPQQLREVAAFVFSLEGTRPDEKPGGNKFTLM